MRCGHGVYLLTCRVSIFDALLASKFVILSSLVSQVSAKTSLPLHIISYLAGSVWNDPLRVNYVQNVSLAVSWCQSCWTTGESMSVFGIESNTTLPLVFETLPSKQTCTVYIQRSTDLGISTRRKIQNKYWINLNCYVFIKIVVNKKLNLEYIHVFWNIILFIYILMFNFHYIYCGYFIMLPQM